MAQKLGFMQQWWGGTWADRDAINQNAETLESVEANVTELQRLVSRQAQEILRLRATITGIVEVLHDKVALDDADLERAVNTAWEHLSPPASAAPATSTTPYRDGATSTEPTPDDIAAATKLIRTAEGHHFGKRFADARAAYQEVIDRYGTTKQATIARQQLKNLQAA